MTPEGLQQFLWQEISSDPVRWWYKTSEDTPDFRHYEALRLNNWLKPACLEWQLGNRKTRITRRSTLLQVHCWRHLEAYVHDGKVSTCRVLCEDGQVTLAVQALTVLVQRGRHIPNNLFYLALKRCIALKDLVLGRRLHALTVQSGYEGNAFLATHLILLYASHGRLEEAMRVFSTVPSPSIYNWASMIFAYARHGEPMKAIGLYGKMRESTVKPDNRIFVAVLKACARAGDLAAGKDVHAHIRAREGKPDIFVQNSLVDMYVKCGSLGDARQVFDKLPHRDVVTWNAMIAGYANQGMGQEALSLYSSMLRQGVTPPDPVTFVCLLQACASIGVTGVKQGQQIHAQIEERGLQDNPVVANSLINMYAKCERLEDAQAVFDDLSQKDVVTWTTMISGYAQQGMVQEALSLFKNMLHDGITPSASVTFVCLLHACASIAALQQGKQLHAQIEEQGLTSDVVVGNSLVNMYAKCGSLENAQRVFEGLPQKNVVTWNAIIAGYAQEGMGEKALALYSSMQQEGMTIPDSVTYVCLLQACAGLGEAAQDQGKVLHAQIEERGFQADIVVGNSLVNMYAKCGSIENAERVFEGLLQKNVVTWNAMISGYAQHGMGQEALSLYRSMRQEGITLPGSVTFVCLLQACASVGVSALHQGKQLHAQIERQGLQADVVVGSSLVNMYVKCGGMEEAQRVFQRLCQKDVVTWNTMIAGCAQQGMGQEALCLYDNMQQSSILPDSVTFVCLLQACASVGVAALHQGKQLHAQIQERQLQDDLIVGNSLITMYAKLGSLDDARSVFDRLPHRDVVTWTAMMTGYAQEGMGQEALSLYSSMQHNGITPPDSVTFVSLLQACANVTDLPLGKQLHAQIEGRGFQGDVDVGASLVNMYAKCGSMVDSQKVFDSLAKRDIVAWGALITGYTRQGESEIVFHLVDRMRQEGIQPNGVTFLNVLTVCSHVGLVDEGRQYFKAMSTDYGISPTIEHYTCMIDMLSRAGYLDEALLMVKRMPFQPDSTVWLCLLGACRKWSNVEIGRQAFELAVNLDENNAPAYVLMSNIYAGAQMWAEAKEMQARRKRCRAWKEPGQSWWTDVEGGLHWFVVGDGNHQESDQESERLHARSLK